MTERNLTSLEAVVLKRILSGNDVVSRKLRSQLRYCQVLRREFTGVGFFAYLSVDCQSCRAVTAPERLWLGGNVVAELSGLEHGAGFALLVSDGYLYMLEGYSFDEPWPSEIDRFAVRPIDDGRAEEA